MATNRNRRFRHALIRVYRPVRGTDEDWGVETTEYEFVRTQTIKYLTTATMSAGTRQLHHGREENWGLYEAIAPAYPVIEDNDIITIVAPDGTDETAFVVRKSFILGRNRSRLVLDEFTPFQRDFFSEVSE